MIAVIFVITSQISVYHGVKQTLYSPKAVPTRNSHYQPSDSLNIYAASLLHVVVCLLISTPYSFGG